MKILVYNFSSGLWFFNCIQSWISHLITSWFGSTFITQIVVYNSPLMQQLHTFHATKNKGNLDKYLFVDCCITCIHIIAFVVQMFSRTLDLHQYVINWLNLVNQLTKMFQLRDWSSPQSCSSEDLQCDWHFKLSISCPIHITLTISPMTCLILFATQLTMPPLVLWVYAG